MTAFTLPRHGSRPRRLPPRVAPKAKLPGAIDMVFVDGHAELVPLEKLWQLNWHRKWQAPAKRPGL
jgi:prepilin-type processing-associated H-X9-DG protein